jgi:hypothetical protein
VFNSERIFMPIPQQLGRGDRMGRGPYEKSGILGDTALPPLRTVTSTYDIFFPFKEEERDDGETVRTFPSESLEVEVRLWYLPYGTMEDNAVLWFEEKRKVKVSTAY